MTDLPSRLGSVPTRLGVTARYEDQGLELDLTPQPETLHHGVIRASVLSYVVDVVAGITVDRDPNVWTLTTDMTVRMRCMAAPARVTAVNRVVRRGRRSVTCTVEMTDEAGRPFAAGAIGFASLPRRDTDPPKPLVSPQDAVELFDGLPGLTRPLRDEAGIEVVDAARGVVQLDVTPEVRNPVGTLQGAMVALVAEAAAEELLATRTESPVVITDLDLRYLAQAPTGPVRTSVRVLDDSPLAPLEISLVDTSTDTLTTLVYARGARPEI
jgi:acyl-coenzyme A thioesterase PaaI-like protein